jgi:hypothetical protein
MLSTRLQLSPRLGCKFLNSYFYGNLTDQKEEQVLIFEKVKELMDAEALSSPRMPVALEESLVHLQGLRGKTQLPIQLG